MFWDVLGEVDISIVALRFFLDRTDLKKNEDSLVPFPLACWQDFVFGDEEEQRLQVLKELHVLWNFSDAQGAEDRVESENH